MNKAIVETLDFERETKGSVLYKNQDVHGGTAIYNIYVRKGALGEVFPDKITVTVEDAGE